MQKYFNTVADPRGNVIGNATITVTTLAGAAATIYSDNGTTVITSLRTNTLGYFEFYAADGHYNVTISKNGMTTITLRDILLEDPADAPFVVASELAAEDGAELVGSDDGASGSLWTTVAGFIARVLSSAGASIVGFVQSGTGAIPRTAQDKHREFISSSDYSTIQQAFDAAQLQGKALKLVGEVQGELVIADKDNWTIFADSPDAGSLKKVVDTRSYVIRALRCSNFFINNIGVDCNSSLAGRFGGISLEDCERFVIGKTEVTAPSDDGAGILAYSSTSARLTGAHVVGCKVFGTGTSGNGVLLVDYENSSIENCEAFDCNGVPGTSPGIGLQLKNDCYNCRITGGGATNCASGVGYGSDTAIGPTYCTVDGTLVEDCATGLLSINASYCKTKFAAHYLAKVGHVVDFNDTSVGNTVEVATFNVGNLREIARFRTGAAGNTVLVSGMSRVGLTAKVVAFDLGVTDNEFVVQGTSQAISDMSTLVNDISGNTTNLAYSVKNARLVLTDSLSRRILQTGASGADSSAAYLFEMESAGDVLLNFKNSGTATSSGIGITTPTGPLKAGMTYSITGDFWNFVVNSVSVLRMFSTVVRAVTDNAITLGGSAFRFVATYSVQFRPGAGAVIWTSGAGTPEGSVTAPIGSLYTRSDGGAVTTLYIKESGAGNTGWVAK